MVERRQSTREKRLRFTGENLATGTQKAMEGLQENRATRSPDPPAPVALTAVPAYATASPRGLSPWFLSPAVFLVAAGATFLLLLFRTSSVTASTPQSGALSNSQAASLGMRVETDGPGLLLSWNRYSRAVQSAQSGVLAIQDGPQHRDVALDRNQIATGSVFYRPAADDVSFRLDLRDVHGASAAQILRVLDASPRKPAAGAVHPDAALPPEKPHETERKPIAIPQSASRPGMRLASNTSPIPAPPPAVETGPASDPVTGVLQLAPVAPSPALSQPAAPAAALGAPTVPKESPAYVPPRPVKWVQPNVQMTQPLDIKVKIRIDETGHVTAAHALIEGPKPDRKLLAAAAAAVRQWTFEPAKVRGANVSCEETVVIHFGPEAQ
jgi:TonB family protein